MKRNILDCDEYEKGKEIAKCGDFHRTFQILTEQGLLKKCVLSTQEEYQPFFEKEGFEPEEKMWEMLTILGLYDEATMKHSIRTFSVVKDIATKTLKAPRGESIILKKYIEEAGVSLRDILFGALGHDVGKIKLPVEILHNSLTDSEMNRILIEMIKRGERLDEIGKKIGYSRDELTQKSDEEIIARIYEKGIRPVNLVPIFMAFPETKYPGLLSILKERGFSENETIKTAAQIHEAEGQKIFEKLGESIVADLVGHHHNYQKDDENELRCVMEIPSLKSRGRKAFFGVYNIIKIADLLDSLESKRPYKEGMSKVSALAELAHQAETDRLERSICYLWVNNEYERIKKTMLGFGMEYHNLQNKKAVEIIEKFLNDTKTEFDRRYEDR